MNKYIIITISNEESYTISSSVSVERCTSFESLLYGIKNLKEVDYDKERAIAYSENREPVYHEELEEYIEKVYFEITYIVRIFENEDFFDTRDLVYFHNKFGTLDTKEYIGL